LGRRGMAKIAQRIDMEVLTSDDQAYFSNQWLDDDGWGEIA
jgi:hypothetical protein